MSKSRWLLLMVVGVLLNTIYIALYYQIDDEAVLVLAIQRILGGELPYRDFTSDISPGSYFLALPYFYIFGFSPEAIRGLLALLAALIGLVIQAIANQVIPNRWKYLPWLIWVSNGVTTHMILSYHWFGSLFVTVGVYYGLTWAKNGSKSSASGLGVCGSLSFWCLQSSGAVLALSSLILWLRFRPKNLLWVFLGALVGSLLLWAPLSPWATIIWQENFQVIGHHLASRHSDFHPGLGPQMLINYLRQPSDLYLLFNTALTLERYTLFYPLLIAGIIFAEYRRDTDLSVLCYSLLAFALVNWSRQTVAYLGYAGPLYALITCKLLASCTSARISKVIAGFMILQYSLGYYCLHAYFYIPIQTRSGIYWSANKVEAALMTYVHEWVQKYTPPGTPVFAYPYFTSLYTTESLINPTREALLVEGVFPQERMQQCQQVLRQKNIQFIFVQPLVASAVSDVCSLSSDEYQRVATTWKKELLEDYQVLESQGILSLYRRTGNPLNSKPEPPKEKQLQTSSAASQTDR